MSSTTRPVTGFPALATRIWQGAVAGIGGGIVFGMLMAMMGMLTTIAGMVGSTSPIVGALIHLVISAGIGASFGLLVPIVRFWLLVGAGAIYGMVWWVLGPLVLMPAMLGMPLFAISAPTVMSLMGHIIFGLVTAAILYGLRRRTQPA
jgi:hypothetical protein